MPLLTQEELMKATGHKRRAPLERCLRDRGIPYHYGCGGRIFTTAEAVNASLGLTAPKRPPSEEVEFA